jgi:hypothetical protein
MWNFMSDKCCIYTCLILCRHAGGVTSSVARLSKVLKINLCLRAHVFKENKDLIYL